MGVAEKKFDDGEGCEEGDAGDDGVGPRAGLLMRWGVVSGRRRLRRTARGRARSELGAAIFECREETFVAVGDEEIDPLVFREAFGNLALFKANRNDVDGAVRFGEGVVEGEADFLLEVAFFGDGGAGEADEEDGAGLDGVADFAVPIGTGGDGLFVEPGGEVGGEEAVIESAPSRRPICSGLKAMVTLQLWPGERVPMQVWETSTKSLPETPKVVAVTAVMVVVVVAEKVSVRFSELEPRATEPKSTGPPGWSV